MKKISIIMGNEGSKLGFILNILELVFLFMQIKK